ncbi:MAG: hypothetical protein PHU45_05350 [Bacilli bacterium]|nr:hypothetical protein [Bacilli bacterium]
MRYYVNKNQQVGGEHEVHTSDCIFLPELDNRIYLGEYISCQQAVTIAKKYYNEVDGCSYCCNACHRR